eukprot:gene2810-1795_t
MQILNRSSPTKPTSKYRQSPESFHAQKKRHPNHTHTRNPTSGLQTTPATGPPTTPHKTRNTTSQHNQCETSYILKINHQHKCTPKHWLSKVTPTSKRKLTEAQPTSKPHPRRHTKPHNYKTHKIPAAHHNTSKLTVNQRPKQHHQIALPCTNTRILNRSPPTKPPKRKVISIQSAPKHLASARIVPCPKETASRLHSHPQTYPMSANAPVTGLPTTPHKTRSTPAAQPTRSITSCRKLIMQIDSQTVQSKYTNTPNAQVSNQNTYKNQPECLAGTLSNTISAQLYYINLHKTAQARQINHIKTEVALTPTWFSLHIWLKQPQHTPAVLQINLMARAYTSAANHPESSATKAIQMAQPAAKTHSHHQLALKHMYNSKIQSLSLLDPSRKRQTKFNSNPSTQIRVYQTNYSAVNFVSVIAHCQYKATPW